MIPSPWVALVLGLAAYRVTRLAGWDDWPPIYKIRAWLIGERWVRDRVAGQVGRLTHVDLAEGGGITIEGVLGEGITPWPDDEPHPVYSRPLLAHLVHCPFCIGWWISLAVYLAWLLEPTWAVYVAAPFALSGFVGIVAKNLDS